MMSRHLPDPSVDALLPESLQRLIGSRAPDRRLAVAMTDSRRPLGDREFQPDLWFSDEELRQLATYSFEKRRNEWLSGRICAKQAAMELLRSYPEAAGCRPRDIVIVTGPTGRPSLSIACSPAASAELDISISHSHGRAAGLAAPGYCGIDIQLLNNTLFKVKNRYCDPVETAVLEAIPADELVQLGLLWVAKEAVRKCLSGVHLAGFQELKLERISEEGRHYLLSLQPAAPFTAAGLITVATHFSDVYAIGVCTVARERLHAGTA